MRVPTCRMLTGEKDEGKARQRGVEVELNRQAEAGGDKEETKE